MTVYLMVHCERSYHLKVATDLIVVERGNYTLLTKCIMSCNLWVYLQIKSLPVAAVYTKFNKIYSLLCLCCVTRV
jgi:hypothetical protein